jgi:Asp-tRNA(Asn)/Glu-tRNA(Gln) amidotransferase A subunit family amidase
VPVAVKDQFWTKGILTTNGSRVYRDFVPDEDATVMTRLQWARLA